MIVVSGKFAFTPGQDDAVRAAMIDMMNDTAKEDGCLFYRFLRDVEHPGHYRVYEEWQSEAHLAAHMETAHMATFRTRLGAIGVISRDVKKMWVEKSEQL